jgi:hypothetical protein
LDAPTQLATINLARASHHDLPPLCCLILQNALQQARLQERELPRPRIRVSPPLRALFPRIRLAYSRAYLSRRPVYDVIDLDGEEDSTAAVPSSSQAGGGPSAAKKRKIERDNKGKAKGESFEDVLQRLEDKGVDGSEGREWARQGTLVVVGLKRGREGGFG